MGWWSKKKVVPAEPTEPATPDPAVVAALLWVRGESPAGFRRYMKQLAAQVEEVPYRYEYTDKNDCMKHFHSIVVKVNNINRYALSNEEALRFVKITRTDIPTVINQFVTDSLDISVSVHVYAAENFQKAVSSISRELDMFPTIVKSFTPNSSFSREIENFMELISRATRLAKTAEQQYVVERAITQDLPQILNYLDIFNRADFRQRAEAEEIFHKQMIQLRIPLEHVVSNLTDDVISEMKTHLTYLQERNNVQLPQPSRLTLDSVDGQKKHQQSVRNMKSQLNDFEDEIPW